MTLMRPSASLALLFISLSTSVVEVSAFHGPLVVLSTPSSSPPTRLFLSSSVSSDDDSGSSVSLRLEGKVTYSCDPVPMSSTSLADFFAAVPQRNCLMTAGNQRSLVQVDTTPQLLATWQSRVADLGASAASPTIDDAVVKVRTGGFQFPGIKVESNAFIGCKLLKDELVYEFVLIDDEREVSGLPPIVWVFNQLVSGGKSKDDDDGADGSSVAPLSLTRVSAKTSPDGSNVVFTSDGGLAITISFPKFLLRILPTSKEKSEEQGSKAIQKVLEKDIKASMDVLQEQYTKWLQQQPQPVS